MDLDQLKQILDLVREHELSEFEIEQDGLRLKIRKDAAGAAVRRVTAPPSVARGAPRRSRPRVPTPSAGRASAPRTPAEDGDRARRRQVADRRHVLPVARAGRACVRRDRRRR